MYEPLCYLDVRDRAARVRERQRVNIIEPPLTLFGFFQSIAIINGPIIAFMVGRSKFGLTGAVIAAVLGIPIGYIVGTAPMWLMWLSAYYYGIRKAKTEVLKAKLKNVSKSGVLFRS